MEQAVTSDVLATRLEGVGKLSSTGLVPAIDMRLKVWAEFHQAVSDGGSGSGRNAIAALMASGGVMVRCTNTENGNVPDYILETQQAIAKLTDAQRVLIELQYVEVTLTTEQKFKFAGLASTTFYRRLAAIHHEILFLLKRAKPVKAPARNTLLERKEAEQAGVSFVRRGSGDVKPKYTVLKMRYYQMIERGEQDCEIRPNNYRGWNTREVYPGRDLLFSGGYGKAHRLVKEVTKAAVTPDLTLLDVPEWHIEAVKEIYGDRDEWLVAYV